MATTQTALNASRCWQEKRTVMTEDWDGNIMDVRTVDGDIYYYDCGKIPAYRIEGLLRAITVPTEWHQSILMFHFAAQGKYKINYVYKTNFKYKNKL